MVKGLNVFPLRSGTKQRHLFSTLLFNITLEVLTRKIKEIKGIKIRKKENCPYLSRHESRNHPHDYVEKKSEVSKKTPKNPQQNNNKKKIQLLEYMSSRSEDTRSPLKK